MCRLFAYVNDRLEGKVIDPQLRFKMELPVGSQVVLGSVPTPSPGWITPVTFVLSVWALSLVMACCFGAACYKAWCMPRPSQEERRASGTRRENSSMGERPSSSRVEMPSSSGAPRVRVREGLETVGGTTPITLPPVAPPRVENPAEGSRTISPARNPRRRSITAAEAADSDVWVDHQEDWAMTSPGGLRVRFLQDRPTSRGAVTRRMVEEASPGLQAGRHSRQR